MHSPPSSHILRSACVLALKVTPSQPSGTKSASPKQVLAEAADLQTGTPGHAAKVSQQTAGRGHWDGSAGLYSCAKALADGREGGREERRLQAAAKFHLPRIQQPSSWPPRTLTSLSLFSPVSAAFPGFPFTLVTLMDRVTTSFPQQIGGPH